MKLKYLFIILTFLSIILFSKSVPRDDSKKPKDLVIDFGYPFETHYVKTKDGYILELHRISGGRGNNGNKKEKKKNYPVFIKHGLGECSSLFYLGGPKRSLAFILADQGYDVWLGNSRGSRYSRNHTFLPAESFGFWDFSWHEIGLYDMPAMMDYILEKTDNKKLFLLCHSQGCTETFVLVSLEPKYNDKILLSVHLAPAVFMGNSLGLCKLAAKWGWILYEFFQTLGHTNFLGESTFLRMITNTFCAKGMITQPICILAISIIAGFSPSQVDTNIFNQFLTYFPSGGSSKQLLHYRVNILDPGKFKQYDYGTRMNKKVYNSSIPPNYPLEKVTHPVAIFYGAQDFLADPKDVKLLVKTLSNVIYNQSVNGFSHFDFLIGIDASKIYDKVYKLLEPYNDK